MKINMKRILVIIVVIILVILGSVLTYFLYKSGLFFSAEGRYNELNLNYMGVSFENESDINAFNEGYSESSSCPWGFQHNGIDYFFNNNSNVLAAAPGQVWEIQTRTSEGENKYHVRIRIRFNKTVEIGYNFEPWTTKLNDLNKQINMFNVKVGDWVSKGDIIARFLQCNESAHIHFDIVEGGIYYCPIKYFALDGYTQLMNLIYSYHPTWNLCYS